MLLSCHCCCPEGGNTAQVSRYRHQEVSIEEEGAWRGDDEDQADKNMLMNVIIFCLCSHRNNQRGVNVNLLRTWRTWRKAPVEAPGLCKPDWRQSYSGTLSAELQQEASTKELQPCLPTATTHLDLLLRDYIGYKLKTTLELQLMGYLSLCWCR